MKSNQQNISMNNIMSKSDQNEHQIVNDKIISHQWQKNQFDIKHITSGNIKLNDIKTKKGAIQPNTGINTLNDNMVSINNENNLDSIVNRETIEGDIKDIKQQNNAIILDDSDLDNEDMYQIHKTKTKTSTNNATKIGDV